MRKEQGNDQKEWKQERKRNQEAGYGLTTKREGMKEGWERRSKKWTKLRKKSKKEREIKKQEKLKTGKERSKKKNGKEERKR